MVKKNYKLYSKHIIDNMKILYAHILCAKIIEYCIISFIFQKIINIF